MSAFLWAVSVELPETSNIKIASGSPLIKKRFLACSRLFLVQSKITLSINSQAYNSWFIAKTVALRLSLILLKCEATIILSLGCTASNCKVIAVEKTNVPSLPDKSLAKFIMSFLPPNKSESSNSSTA